MTTFLQVSFFCGQFNVNNLVSKSLSAYNLYSPMSIRAAMFALYIDISDVLIRVHT